MGKTIKTRLVLVKKTPRGTYYKDACGLWHYHPMPHMGKFEDYIRDAVENKPVLASWFWWEKCPAPIEKNDTTETLTRRYREWRHDHDHDPALLITRIYTQSLPEQ